MPSDAATPFFRTEVLEHRRRQWLGDIVLARPLSFVFLTSFACLSALSIAAYLFVGDYTRKAHVLGFLVPKQGLARVYAPGGGTIVERLVKEGDVVAAGAT